MPSLNLSSGARVHFVEDGGGDDTFVLVHGLGGSHLNWRSIHAPLAKRGRVLAPDLGGFGRTAPPTEGSHVDANLALLADFVRTTAPGRRVVLVGNSMGAYLSLRLAAEHPTLVRALVLVDPAAPVPLGSKVDPTVAAMFATYMLPGVAQGLMRRRAAKVGPEGTVRDLMKLCTVDIARVDPVVIDAHVALARERAAMPWAIDAFLDAARSLLIALANPFRYHQHVDAVRAPTLLVHGARDRLIPVAAARALAERRPDWRYAEHHDLGHTPQLESPGWLLGEMEPWLDALPAR